MGIQQSVTHKLFPLLRKRFFTHTHKHTKQWTFPRIHVVEVGITEASYLPHGNGKMSFWLHWATLPLTLSCTCTYCGGVGVCVGGGWDTVQLYPILEFMEREKGIIIIIVSVSKGSRNGIKIFSHSAPGRGPDCFQWLITAPHKHLSSFLPSAPSFLLECCAGLQRRSKLFL